MVASQAATLRRIRRNRKAGIAVFPVMMMPEPEMPEQRSKVEDRRRNPYEKRQRQLGDERRRDFFPGKAQYQ